MYEKNIKEFLQVIKILFSLGSIAILSSLHQYFYEMKYPSLLLRQVYEHQRHFNFT